MFRVRRVKVPASGMSGPYYQRLHRESQYPGALVLSPPTQLAMVRAVV